jgi:two-component system response regulator
MRNGSTNESRVEVLLVEENAADRALILNALKKAKVYNCIHALQQGSEALDFLFRTGAFAGEPPLPAEVLVLLSMNIRDIHALDVLRKIKTDERTRSYPVIILTASQEERGVMQSYKLGANACIVKPIDLSKLIEAISELRLGWLLVGPEENRGK